MRVLKGAIIYDENGNPQVTAAAQPDPTGAAGRSIELLDHAVDTPTERFGHDRIAGGAGDDLSFGQLGNDTIQGDSAIAESASTTDPSVEAPTDGDDYIEGGGGDDLIFGNLGQDDIIGGSSNLFGNDTPQERPDGKDTILGGAGTRIARNDPGDATAEGHARDADTIVGDNGNIFRLVGTNGVNSGSFLKFTYDNYSNNLPIIPRAIELLDYVQGGSPNNLGSDDLIHGEAGDDTIHAMTGNDVVFGEGQDDDIYGGTGSDRLYGGTGEDGIIGDDGKILTSRNGQTETLYGITTPNQEMAISLPGPFTGAVINITGRLKKEVDLVAFDQGGNDVIYGGLGDDFLHGGAGDDAISGAEALAEFYNSNPVTNLNPLNYDPVTRKLAAYDANNPRQKINGFLFNFEATDAAGNKIDDGKDNIFGDLGNDWLVGGTLNDRLFGGLGDDVLNADDNHDTNGGKNNAPDAPEFADGDFAFGGGGLDVMIANTGNDRLFDWNGEFNTYVVPFSPFGEPTVVRAPSPQIFEFLLALGKASGADRTLAEPNGELGLVTQKDPQWQNQQGSPRDPQPGNLPGVQRDTQGGPEDDSASGNYFRRNGATANMIPTSSTPTPPQTVTVQDAVTTDVFFINVLPILNSGRAHR
jgi:Ca2+-binding RTX toxin-like protein